MVSAGSTWLCLRGRGGGVEHGSTTDLTFTDELLCLSLEVWSSTKDRRVELSAELSWLSADCMLLLLSHLLLL